MKTKAFLMASALAAVIALPASAATLIYNLDVSAPSAGLPSGTLGTVTATEDGANLDILVALDPTKAEFRYSPDDSHVGFVFQLDNTTHTLSTIMDNALFSQVAGGATATPFGSWNYALDCSKGAKGAACQSGWSPDVNPTTLSFVINNASLASLLGVHTYDGQAIWFAADVVTPTGATGSVGATLDAAGVPEPASWAMMMVGFLGAGALLRRRNTVAALAL